MPHIPNGSAQGIVPERFLVMPRTQREAREREQRIIQSFIVYTDTFFPEDAKRILGVSYATLVLGADRHVVENLQQRKPRALEKTLAFDTPESRNRGMVNAFWDIVARLPDSGYDKEFPKRDWEYLKRATLTALDPSTTLMTMNGMDMTQYSRWLGMMSNHLTFKNAQAKLKYFDSVTKPVPYREVALERLLRM